MIKSNLDVAYDIMQQSESPLTFQKLWEEICKVQGFDEEESQKRMGKFYTNLFMDGRFITLGENTWDLRDRYTFDRVHIDMNDVYHDDDDDNDSDNDDDDENDAILDEEDDDEENEDEDYEKSQKDDF